MIEALTLDFWNTMVVARSNGRARWDRRLSHVTALAQRYDPSASESMVTDAVRSAAKSFDRLWRDESRTLTTAVMVSHVWSELGINVTPVQHDETVTVFESSILAGAPDLTDGLVSFLSWASRDYKLGVISDTMFSPGRVLREFLDRAGIKIYFQTFVFSDETGFSKPDRRSYEYALQELDVAPQKTIHIGDLLRTDVEGALSMNMGAILYAGVEHDTEGDAKPDFVAAHWSDISKYLEGFRTKR